jgi:hypothetical protein
MALRKSGLKLAEELLRAHFRSRKIGAKKVVFLGMSVKLRILLKMLTSAFLLASGLLRVVAFG